MAPLSFPHSFPDELLLEIGTALVRLRQTARDKAAEERSAEALKEYMRRLAEFRGGTLERSQYAASLIHAHRSTLADPDYPVVVDNSPVIGSRVYLEPEPMPRPKPAAACFPPLEALSALARSSRRLYRVLGSELYRFDATGVRYALYWAILTDSKRTAERAMQEGARASHAWFHNGFPLNSDPGSSLMPVPRSQINECQRTSCADGVDPHALNLAAKFNSHRILKLLLDQADQDKPADKWRQSDKPGPLCVAIKGGAIEAAKLLIDMGSPLHSADPHKGWAALKEAVKYNNLKAGRMIARARPDDPTSQIIKDAVMTRAFVDGLTGTYEMLLEEGANIDAPLSDGPPPAPLVFQLWLPGVYHPWSRNRSGLVGAIRLLELGAGPVWYQHSEEHGVVLMLTLLHCISPTPAMSANKIRPLVDTILARFPPELDINTADLEGNTALHVAARDHNVFMMQVLLRRGADPSVENGQGYTPLYMVLLGHRPGRLGSAPDKFVTSARACLDLLLGHGVDLDDAHRVPWHRSIFGGPDMDAPSTLLQLVCSHRFLDRLQQGCTAMARPGVPEGEFWVNYLKFTDRLGDWHARHQIMIPDTARAIQHSIVRYLIERGADPGRIAAGSSSPLRLICGRDNTEVDLATADIMHLLIINGAKLSEEEGKALQRRVERGLVTGPDAISTDLIRNQLSQRATMTERIAYLVALWRNRRSG